MPFFLDPAKVLVVLVVALVVLGPDKLPRAAKQLGALWHQLHDWRERLQAEVHESFPDLPAQETISEVVRSPIRLLDRLADDHERSPSPDSGSGPPSGALALRDHATAKGAEPGRELREVPEQSLRASEQSIDPSMN